MSSSWHVLLMSMLLASVDAHGSVLYPPTRNAIDSTIDPWKGATIGVNNTQQFPQTGVVPQASLLMRACSMYIPGSSGSAYFAASTPEQGMTHTYIHRPLE